MKIRKGPHWTQNISESEKFSLAHFISNFGQYLVELCRAGDSTSGQVIVLIFQLRDKKYIYDNISFH